MTFEWAIRLSEILMGFSFVLQSLEHLKSFNNERILFIPRIALSILLILGVQHFWVLGLLLLLAVFTLHRFQGPYNGGADRMSLLILTSLFLVSIAPSRFWQELAFGYLAVQLVLSYFIAGWVKVVNPDWRTGRALEDVFRFSAYPVSESLRRLKNSPRLLFVMAWGVMLSELLFPFSLVSVESLGLALVIFSGFHFANACIFGLNRFFWIWMAAYPSIVWFQHRFFSSF